MHSRRGSTAVAHQLGEQPLGLGAVLDLDRAGAARLGVHGRRPQLSGSSRRDLVALDRQALARPDSRRVRTGRHGCRTSRSSPSSSEVNGGCSKSFGGARVLSNSGVLERAPAGRSRARPRAGDVAAVAQADHADAVLLVLAELGVVKPLRLEFADRPLTASASRGPLPAGGTLRAGRSGRVARTAALVDRSRYSLVRSSRWNRLAQRLALEYAAGAADRQRRAGRQAVEQQRPTARSRP